MHGSTILLKQTSGIIFAVVFALYKILQVSNKEELKEYAKIAITRLIGSIIVGFCFILYLLITGTMVDFIDYAILGIKTFSNKVKYISLFQATSDWIKALAVIFPIQIFVMSIIWIISYIKKNLRQKEWVKNIIILLAYSVRNISSNVPNCR